MQTTFLRRDGEDWNKLIWLCQAPGHSAAFDSGRVDIVSISDPLIDCNFMVYMFQPDSTQGKFNGSVKAETWKLVINRKLISILQE